jgi:hypothetical protein
VIRHAVWLYFRFTLSFRDVEEMLAERGIDISYETIPYWALKFGRLFAQNLRRSAPRPTGRWHLDEMVVKINGQRMWLWRAVDDEGTVLDLLVQKRRNTVAAVRLLRKLLRRKGATPRSSRQTGLPHTELHSVTSASAGVTDPGPCSTTIELRIPISSFDGENESSNGSSRNVPPRGSFQPTPRSTTPSIYNAALLADRRFGCFGPMPIAGGPKQLQLHERICASMPQLGLGRLS